MNIQNITINIYSGNNTNESNKNIIIDDDVLFNNKNVSRNNMNVDNNSTEYKWFLQ